MRSSVVKLRFRRTFNLVASGNDYAVVVNQSGSTVYTAPKGATYRFDISDSSWTGKNLEIRESATGSALASNIVRRYGTPGTPGAWVDVIILETHVGSILYFGQEGGSSFATQHIDFDSVYNAVISNSVQLTVSNLPALPAQPLLNMTSGATAITASTYSVITEYGGLTHFPNTLPYQSSNKSPKAGRYPVNLSCTDQNIQYNWYKKLYSYNTSTGVKSYNWDTIENTFSTYVPLNSPHYRSRRDYGNVLDAYLPSCVQDGVSSYVENYISFNEEFPLRVNYGGNQIEIPIGSSSQLLPPLDNNGSVIRVTDLPCKGIPNGENDPYSFQLHDLQWCSSFVCV